MTFGLEMKILVPVFVIVSLVTYSIAQDAEEDEKSSLGYYENLALLCFEHGIAWYKVTEPDSWYEGAEIPTKRQVAQKMALQAFGYFLHLKEDSIQKSNRVERFIKITYRSLLPEHRECFLDPFQRKEDNNWELSIVGTEDIESDEDYAKLVNEFYTYFEFSDVDP